MSWLLTAVFIVKQVTDLISKRRSTDNDHWNFVVKRCLDITDSLRLIVTDDDRDLFALWLEGAAHATHTALTDSLSQLILHAALVAPSKLNTAVFAANQEKVSVTIRQLVQLLVRDLREANFSFWAYTQ